MEEKTELLKEMDICIRNIYSGMMSRCFNKNLKAYKRYGAEGITVCPEWKDNPEEFREWCYNNGYARGLQLDRIDNDGDYEPSNCRFVSPRQNQNNKRDTIIITMFGKSLPVTYWADKIGLEESILRRMYYSCENVEQAVRDYFNKLRGEL